MWRRLVIALLCATVSLGFNSNTPLGAPLVNPPSGQNNYLPIANPTWTGNMTGPNLNLTGSLTFSGVAIGGICSAGQFVNALSTSAVPTCASLPAPAAGSITDAMLANAYSGVGACTAGQFVSTLNRNSAPTCTTPATGSFAPLINPAGGQNNYAPIASPVFTGTVAAPTVNVTGTYQVAGAQIACANLSNAAPSCSTDTTNAANITSGRLPAAQAPNTFSTCSNTFTVANGATQNIFSLTSWGASLSGMLTIFTAYANANTMSIYSISTLTMGTLPGYAQLSTSTYGGGTGASFTVTMTEANPQVFSMTNNSGSSETMQYWFSQLGGAALVAGGGGGTLTCY
jgi:hypothetical protein